MPAEEKPNTENTSDSQTTIEELDNNAEKIIFKYSVIASATNLLIPIPGAKVLVDVVGDTIAQYKMVNDLSKNYRLDAKSFEVGKILLVIADNMIAKKITSWIIDFIPIVGNFASALFDFAYTYLIGKVFKILFRTSYTNNKPVDLELIPELIEELWKEAINFVKENWELITGSQKVVLERYELDIKKIINEFEKTGGRKTEVYQKTLEVLNDIFENLKTSVITKDEFMRSMDKIAADLSIPTPELIKTMIMNAKQKGEPIKPELLALLELFDEDDFRKSIS